MQLILAIISAPIVYFGLGWVILSIYWSINPIDGSDLIKDIISTSVLIYGIVACVYNFIMGSNGAHNENENNVAVWVGLGCPALGWFLCAKILPVSEGAMVLNYILCLGSMLYFGYRGWDNILD